MKKQQKIMPLKFINRLATIVFSALAFSAFGQEKVVVDEIISKVDNNIVLKSDLEKAYLSYLAGGNLADPQAKCGILAQLISAKLMVAKAEIDSVTVSDDEVENNLDRRMQLILSQYGGSEAQLEEYYGKSINDIKAEIRDDIEEQLIVQRMQEEIIREVKVTPAEIRRFFAKIPADSLPYFSTEVEVGQIVKTPTVSKESKNELKLRLSQLRDRVLAGEDFESLAREYSQGPSSKYGGNLGFAQRGVMAPQYEANTLKLKPGEISAPFETSFGIHIVQLLERRGNEYNSRHIILIPEPTAPDIEKASAFLDSIKTLIVTDSIGFEKAAKAFSDDKMTAGSGGFLTNDLGGFRVAVEELDPVIFFTTDTMKVGQITHPMKFRQDNGKEAVRILYYRSKIPPHQANLKDDWQKIQAAAVNEKKSKILNKWFETARNDVFVSIDDRYDDCNIMN